MEGRTGRMYSPRLELSVNSFLRMSDSLSAVGQPENLSGWRKTGDKERAMGGRMASIRLQLIWTSEMDGTVHFASIALTRTVLHGMSQCPSSASAKLTKRD